MTEDYDLFAEFFFTPQNPPPLVDLDRILQNQQWKYVPAENAKPIARNGSQTQKENMKSHLQIQAEQQCMVSENGAQKENLQSSVQSQPQQQYMVPMPSGTEQNVHSDMDNQTESDGNKLRPTTHQYWGEHVAAPCTQQWSQHWNPVYQYEQGPMQSSSQQGVQNVEVQNFLKEQTVQNNAETVGFWVPVPEKAATSSRRAARNQWTPKQVEAHFYQQPIVQNSNLSSSNDDFEKFLAQETRAPKRSVRRYEAPVEPLPKRARLSEPVKPTQIPVLPMILALPLKINDVVSTENLAKRILAEMKSRDIPQAKFARQVIGRTQGTLSTLLTRPIPWNLMRSGRQTWLQMLNWLELCKKDQEAVIEGRTLTCCAFEEPIKVAPRRPRDAGNRVVLSPEKKESLMEFFRQKQYPDKEDCETLAAQLGMEVNKVKEFFFNARKNMKRSGGHQGYEVPGSSMDMQ